MRIGSPSITEVEREYLYDAIEKGDVSQGEYISRFEKSWASMNHREHGISCNSGTSAIQLALLALGIGEGDKVIVPSFTMAACAFGVSNVGAEPIFVDCFDDLTIDHIKLRDMDIEGVKAIMVVPIYGRPCSQEVYDFARENNLFVIEDFAEGHGIKPKGDITCYSFQANKIITTGEGGMCLTNDTVIADEIRKLSSLYFNKERDMIHGRIAHNFRMTNLQAAIGLGQCDRFNELKDKRIKIARWYDKYINPKYKMPQREVVWVYDIDCGDKQQLIRDILKLEGIETRYGFKPMEMQSYYLEEYDKLNSYKWSKRILYLPTYFDMTEKDVKKVCKVINKI